MSSLKKQINLYDDGIFHYRIGPLHTFIQYPNNSMKVIRNEDFMGVETHPSEFRTFEQNDQVIRVFITEDIWGDSMSLDEKEFHRTYLEILDRTAKSECIAEIAEKFLIDEGFASEISPRDFCMIKFLIDEYRKLKIYKEKGIK